MLLMLEENDKLNSSDDYDQVVRAEIPNPNEEPKLYGAVLRHMIHDPCGIHNSRSPCMKLGSFKRNYPKPFAPTTVQGNDSYPVYRSRGNHDPVPLDHNARIMVDNRWVIPYNSWLSSDMIVILMLRFVAALRVLSILAFEVHHEPIQDEIKQFVDARWVCAPEALWRIFKFVTNRLYPSVERLQIHLLEGQTIHFYPHQRVVDILADDTNSMTMLTNQRDKLWNERMNNHKVIGWIYAVSSNEGEKFHLHILLNHVKGPISFENLRTVNDIVQPTFKKAVKQRGLLEDDDNIRRCLCKASNIRMPSALPRLFVTILVYCEPHGVRRLWDEFHSFMVEDYYVSSITNNTSILNKLLQDLNGLLVQDSKSVSDYDLPQITQDYVKDNTLPRIIQDEVSLDISEADHNVVQNLNEDQMAAYNSIVSSVEQRDNAIFFSTLRSKCHIILATTTFGIAATILSGRRTTHSRFKIPFSLDASSTCSISIQPNLAELIKKTSAVVWDEAPMAHMFAFETLDRTFKDIIGVDLPYGGKVMIFGGDFRQVLPVVPKDFSEFLLHVSNGEQETIIDDMMQLPSSMVIPWNVFPDLECHVCDARYLVERAIITPKNEDVDKLNKMIIDKFSGAEHILYSFDSVEDDVRNLYQQEFLNSISSDGLCNGTRLACHGAYNNLIDAKILSGQFVGTRVQTIPNVGIYLPDHVFSHGQLYVALSRGVSASTTKVLVKKGELHGHEGVFTRNIVYKDILLPSNST
ncbi:unnamed protein product [Malus baccata var. baccata]